MSPEPGIDFLSRRIHLVTGKGGVGRTTLSAALATAAARHGKRVLLTEIGDPEGGYSAIGRKFGREQLTPDPEPLGPPGLRGCHVWATRGQEKASTIRGRASARPQAQPLLFSGGCATRFHPWVLASATASDCLCRRQPAAGLRQRS